MEAVRGGVWIFSGIAQSEISLDGMPCSYKPRKLMIAGLETTASQRPVKISFIFQIHG